MQELKRILAFTFVLLVFAIATKDARAQMPSLLLDGSIKFNNTEFTSVTACRTKEAAETIAAAMAEGIAIVISECKLEAGAVTYIRHFKPQRGGNLREMHVYEIELNKEQRFTYDLRPPEQQKPRR